MPDLDLLPEYSLSQFPNDYEGELRMCGHRYVCKTNDSKTFRWERDERTDVKGVVGCRTDSVIAAAAVNHCYTSIDQAGGSEVCQRKEPCLRVSDDPNQLQCFKELGPGGSSGMPHVLDAGWQCVDTKPTPNEWEKLRREWIGDSKDGLMTLILDRKDMTLPEKPLTPIESVEEFPTQSYPLEDPPPRELPEEPSSILEESPLPPSEDSQRTLSEFPIEEEPPNEPLQELVGDTERYTELQDEEKLQVIVSTTTNKCDWFQGKVSLSCNKDSDCPMDPFDTWFDVTMSQINKDSVSMSPQEFLKTAKSKSSYKVALNWSNHKTNKTRLTPHDMNTYLAEMHKTDVTFRNSVKETINKDDKYAKKFDEKVKGLCQANRCTTGLPRPTVQLFNGTNEVTFVETDEGINFTVEGGKKSFTPIEVQSCDADNAPQQCRENGSRDVHVLTEPKLTRSTPVAPYYRLNFSEEGREYLLRNMVSVTGSDPSVMRERCASTLCDVNSLECPAPHCFRDQGRCKPNAELVHKVELL